MDLQAFCKKNLNHSKLQHPQLAAEKEKKLIKSQDTGYSATAAFFQHALHHSFIFLDN